MNSRMEMIFVGDTNNAYKTGIGAMMETDAATWADFRRRKNLAVPMESATFLLDYYNRKGDLSDTIPLSADGYHQITGEPVLTAAEYAETDKIYWAQQQSASEVPHD